MPPSHLFRLISGLVALAVVSAYSRAHGEPASPSLSQSALGVGNALNVCRYHWASYATGWRTRTWEPWNCTNGLPVANSVAVGQGQNGTGNAGQVFCTTMSGGHYNHPSWAAETTGTVTCVYVPPASSPVQHDPPMTRCTYMWSEYATGWRSRTWQASDCSHGLPAPGSVALGQGQNGSGTEGQVSCSPTQGAHYNHPTADGATGGTVSCLFLSPRQPARPEATLCSFTWSDHATGWRNHIWTAADCSHGLPQSNWVAVGQAQNGNGTSGQVSCSPTQGAHYNHPSQAGATSATVRCLFVNRPSPPSGTGYSHDLDSDGVNDTLLSLVPCDTGSARQCLLAQSRLFVSERRIPLHAESRAATSGLSSLIDDQAPLRLVGDHTGDGLQEVAVLYARERWSGTATYHSPALAVANVDLGTLLADTAAPVGLTTFQSYALRAWPAWPKDPTGRTYPLLAPGYGDSSADPAKEWGHACLFSPGAGGGACGSGFVTVDTEPAPLVYGGSYFREAGGYLQDLDGDGWEDVHLIYHWAILAISSRTGQRLTTTTYDVAGGAQPVGFHSGRHYGTHAAVRKADGTRRAVMVAGNAVGSFTDYFCNVSRYAAVLESPAANPLGRVLKWSAYHGFHSNNWTSWPYVPPGGTAPSPARWGDFADNCIHRYADSRSVMDGMDVLVLDYFRADYSAPLNAALAGRCKDEQYQLYMEPAWTQAKQDAWAACARRHLGAKGRWGMKVLRESDGAGLTGSQDSYVWGWSNRLVPGGEIVYLVEDLPNPVRFDLLRDDGTPLPPRQLRVLALVGGLWSVRGVLPVAGRPVLVDMAKAGPLGTGDFYPLRALRLEDRDGDGLLDVQVNTGTGQVWVGYSQAAGSFVQKG